MGRQPEESYGIGKEILHRSTWKESHTNKSIIQKLMHGEVMDNMLDNPQIYNYTYIAHYDEFGTITMTPLNIVVGTSR